MLAVGGIRCRSKVLYKDSHVVNDHLTTISVRHCGGSVSPVYGMKKVLTSAGPVLATLQGSQCT